MFRSCLGMSESPCPVCGKKIQRGAYRCPWCQISLAPAVPPEARPDRVVQVPRVSELDLLSIPSKVWAGFVLCMTSLAIGVYILMLLRGKIPDDLVFFTVGGYGPAILLLAAYAAVVLVHAVAGVLALLGVKPLLPIPGGLCLLDAAGAVAVAARLDSKVWAVFLVVLAALDAALGVLLLWSAHGDERERLGLSIAGGTAFATLIVAFLVVEGRPVPKQDLSGARMKAASNPSSAKAEVERLASMAEQFRQKFDRFPESHAELVRFMRVSGETLIARYRSPGPHKCRFAVEGIPGGATYSICSPDCHRSPEGDAFWSRLYRFKVRGPLRSAMGRVEHYHRQHGRYPENLEGTSDLWGRPFRLQNPCPSGCPLAVGSLGADGKPGGLGADADLWVHHPSCRFAENP